MWLNSDWAQLQNECDKVWPLNNFDRDNGDQNLSAKIQIFSHASSTSTAQYNMKLSQKRMNKVISYFHENGIDLLRMTYKAYGESKLLNRCEDDQECEDAMHQVNRRTELRIIQENKD